jgi:hypothetical protein
MSLNYYQASTSPEKLRGAYYTPPELVRLMLETLDPRPGDTVLDPSCGDGEFLVGAVHLLAERYGARAGRQLAGRLAGMDVDPEAVAAARERVREAVRQRFGVTLADGKLPVRCLSALDFPSREALAARVPAVGSGRLLIAGNPPYVEAKRLSGAVKAELRARYPDASAGAPDLYLYFLHVCLGWLRDDDRLALVLPNKALVNTAGLRIRERLLQDGMLAGIDFATQAGIFPGAAVYPVALYAGAPGKGGGAAPSGGLRGSPGVPSGQAVRLARVERAGEGLHRRPLPPLPAAAYRTTGTRALFPSPAEPALAEALLRLLRRLPEGRLDDVLDIRWAVSFHRRGLRERYVVPSRPESRHARRFLGGGAFSGNGEVERYRLEWAGWWIDYDEERLREEGNPLPDPVLFARPKVVICQNGRTLRAAWDEEGYVLKDTFLCGLPRPTAHPLAVHSRALVGLLCSRAAHFFYAHVFHGGHVNDGYLHFLRSFLADIPLGAWTLGLAEEVAALAARREGEGEQQALEEAIEERVGCALELSVEEQEAVRQWCEEDPNWNARTRIRRPSAGG